MCPPPCGRRRSGRCSSAPKITKDEVAIIISEGKYSSCEFKMGKSSKIEPYKGCDEGIRMMLEEKTTTVKVADERFKAYREGYKTIVINTPSANATLYLYVKN